MDQCTQHPIQWTQPTIQVCQSAYTSNAITELLSRLNLTEQGQPETPAGLPVFKLSQIDIDAPQNGIGTLALTRPDGVQLSISFTDGKTRHRYNEAGHGARQLQKALGITPVLQRESVKVIDATGGLGQDAWAMASLGIQVCVYECQPVVYALLCNALQRAAQKDPYQQQAARIHLVHANASDALASDETTADVHAIYLDPMYPPSRKSARAKKGMQFLQSLTGPAKAEHSRKLLLAALHANVSRVVVKRPNGAPELEGTEQWSGQLTHSRNPNTRYDIYHQSRKF